MESNTKIKVSVEELNENDTIDITLADGKAVCRVTERERFN